MAVNRGHFLQRKRTSQKVKTRAEESNRLGKDFQVELGPNQGTHIAPKVGDLDNISLAGFRTCYRPTIAT